MPAFYREIALFILPGLLMGALFSSGGSGAEVLAVSPGEEGIAAETGLVTCLLCLHAAPDQLPGMKQPPVRKVICTPKVSDFWGAYHIEGLSSFMHAFFGRRWRLLSVPEGKEE